MPYSVHALSCLTAAIFLSACAFTVDERILFASPSLSDLLDQSEDGSDGVTFTLGFEDELAKRIDSGEIGEHSREAIEARRQIALYGRSREHEGKIGLFNGYLFDQPEEFEFELSANSESLIWNLGKDDFIPSSHERSHLETSYGPLETLYIYADDQGDISAPRPLFVHCYGNAANLYNNGTFTALSALPYGDILQFEYPGFFGPDTEKNDLLRTAENFDIMIEALAADINQSAPKRPVIFWGHSLGGLVCSELAARVDTTDGLILETTGANVRAIARAFLPRFSSLFVNLKVAEGLEKYDIPNALETFDAPVLVLGARKDKTLNIDLSLIHI